MRTKRIGLVFLCCVALSAVPARAATIVLTGTGGDIPNLGSFIGTETSSDPGLITDVTLTLFGLTHTWADDLTATLTFQSTTGTVFTDVGGGPISGDYVFNDSFGTALVSPFPSGSYFGTSGGTQILFSTLWNGLAATGDWTLTIADGFGGDQGTLTSWQLDIQVASTAAPVPEPATLLLFGASLAGLAAAQRRRRRG